MTTPRHWIAFGSLALSAAFVAAAEPTPARNAQYLPPPRPPGYGPPLAPPGVPVFPPPPSMRDYSWIHIDSPVPRPVHVHDIITVIVDEKSQVTENSQFNRQKNGVLKAELKNFVRIDSDGNLNTAAQEQPTIEGRLQSQLNTRGQVQSNEGIRYRIAATVVDVLPNGTLVLEARKTIRTNADVWEYSLTGRIRSQDVLPNNQVLSENIANMEIVKRERGRVRDSTRRGILLTLYDFFMPV